MTEIEAVFLDMGGVISLPPVAEAAAFLAAHGADGTYEAVERSHYHAMVAYDEAAGENGAYLVGFLRGAGLPSELAAGLGAAMAGIGWRPAIRSSLEALPDLAATGLPLAIVSNSNGTVAVRLAEAGVAQVGPGPGVALRALVDSGVLGIEKPDPGIFEPALAACGVRPEAAVHVGDSRVTDVAGAHAAGIRPLHFDPYELCPDRRAHEHVRSLREVIALVGATT